MVLAVCIYNVNAAHVYLEGSGINMSLRLMLIRAALFLCTLVFCLSLQVDISSAPCFHLPYIARGMKWTRPARFLQAL